MEHVDRVAARVSFCTLAGLFGGATFAVWKGFPKRATSLKVAGSCALVSTVLFGMERLAYVALESQINDNERRLMLTSHVFAGVAGGGLNGYLYHGKISRGMLFFLPIMLGSTFAELQWEKNKKLRLQEILLEEEGVVETQSSPLLEEAKED
jgi:hypothetical protein